MKSRTLFLVGAGLLATSACGDTPASISEWPEGYEVLVATELVTTEEVRTESASPGAGPTRNSLPRLNAVGEVERVAVAPEQMFFSNRAERLGLPFQEMPGTRSEKFSTHGLLTSAAGDGYYLLQNEEFRLWYVEANDGQLVRRSEIEVPEPFRNRIEAKVEEDRGTVVEDVENRMPGVTVHTDVVNSMHTLPDGRVWLALATRFSENIIGIAFEPDGRDVTVVLASDPEQRDWLLDSVLQDGHLRALYLMTNRDMVVKEYRLEPRG